MKFRRAPITFYICLMVTVFALRPSYADDSPAFAVASVNSTLNGSVYFINAVLEINLPYYIKSAVDQGFDLPLIMEIEVFRSRGMWFDEKVVYIKQQYLLRYHALLDSVSIFDVNAGNRLYYASLDTAIARLSVLIDYPALDNNSLQAGKFYNARIRFGIDSSELPLPLKSSSLWENNWDLKSDWMEWELNP